MKIIQQGQYRGNIIETVLENRGVFNVDLFLNPDNSTDSDPSLFRNVKEGYELLVDHLSDGKAKISIVVDQDADGFVSAALLHQYISKGGCAEINYILHETKAHGLTEYIMKRISEEKPTLVIVPDAGSNDTAQIELLVDNGIDVLVIDHHIVSNFTEKGVIINNQLCENTNRRLVGVGVVYKFLQYMDSQLNKDFTKDYLDLVAVGQIGDASDIADNEIRNLVLTGLDNIKNGFLDVAIGQKNGFGKKLAPKDLSFGVIPLINAVTRVGTLEERDYLFRALAHIGTHEVFPVTKKKKNKVTNKFENIDFNYNIFEFAYDVCTKCKSRQDSTVKKMVENIQDTLVDDAGVIIAFTGDSDNPGITGLVANKIMSKYDKPVLLLNENEDTYTGSGRGHEKTISDFRKWCEDSDLVEFAQGHDNAFGICIHKDKFDRFKQYSRKIEKQDTVYYVDLLTNKPSKEDCEIIDSNKRLFGGTVSEPFIGFVNMSVPKRFIGTKGSVLNIFSWGVTCVMFSTPEGLFDELMNYPDDNVKLNMVGTYSVNEWNGRTSPQLIIKDLEIIYEENEVTVDTIIF